MCYCVVAHLTQPTKRDSQMKKARVPERFAEIARLSDEDRAKHEKLLAGLHTAEEIAPVAQAMFEQERINGPSPLFFALNALNDEDAKQLTGWVLFGRDYDPTDDDSDPATALSGFIQSAVIYPRDVNTDYLMGKPIGEYLQEAMLKLLMTPEEVQRARNLGEDDEGEQGWE